MTFVEEPYTFDRSNVTSRLNATRVGPGLPSNTLAPGNDVNVVVPEPVYSFEMRGRDGEAVPEVAKDGAVNALRAGDGGSSRSRYVAVPQPVYGMTGGTGDESAFPEQQPALTASHGQPGNVAVPAVLLTMREGKDGGGKGPLLSEDESLTLATGNSQILFAPEPTVFAWQAGGDHTSSGAFTDDGTTPTLPRNQTLATTGGYGVRRLTPTECERLQGFDDGWTDPAGSDSARYRALGNAVTVNVPQWLMGRLT